MIIFKNEMIHKSVLLQHISIIITLLIIVREAIWLLESKQNHANIKREKEKAIYLIMKHQMQINTKEIKLLKMCLI